MHSIEVTAPDYITAKREARYRTAQRLFGVAVSYQPEDIFSSISDWSHHSYPQVVTDIVKEGYEQRFNHTPSKADLLLLSTGMQDIHKIITQVLAHHPVPVDESRTREFMARTKTSESIALLALRSTSSMDMVIRSFYFTPTSSYYHLSEDASAITTNHLSAQTYGCPAAGENGVVKPSPLLKRFIPWTGEFVIEAHKQNPLK